MRAYRWDSAKNEQLIRERGISFEEIVWHIAQGHVLDILVSRNERYHDQRQFVINVNGYAYLVPFIERGKEIIFKTIIPSRKLTKQYLRQGGRQDG